MEAPIIEVKGLSQYLATIILPRQAYSSLNARPWISRRVLLIGNCIPSRDTVG